MSASSGPEAALERFVASLRLDYGQWREGVGYDVAALSELQAEERARVLALLLDRLERPGAGWREVEAVAALDTDEARETLAALTKHENLEVRLRACRYLDRADKGSRAAQEVIRILRDPDADVSMKTEQVWRIAENHPTTAMKQALLFCAVDGAPDLRAHAAAMALFLAGKAQSAFDWNFRPLFLEFGASDRAARMAARRKLQALLRGNHGNNAPVERTE